MNFLTPIDIKEYYLRLLASSIRRYFAVAIFNDIFAILNGKMYVQNDTNVILTALRTGKIFYKDGFFRAEKKFSNKIALELERLGAVYKNGGYYINPQNLPVTILNEVAVLQVEAKNKLNSVNVFLANLELADITPFVKGITERMFDTFTNDLYKSMKDKNIPIIELPIDNPSIEIPEEEVARISGYWREKEEEARKLREYYERAKLFYEKDKSREARKAVETAKETLKEFQKQKYKNAPKFDYTYPGNPTSRQVAENYTYNLKYWVKNWEVQDIAKMREDIIEMTKKGARISEIKKYFENRWHVASDKAQFLARNEAGLASTAIKEFEYRNAGCTHFKWLPSTSREKRDLHKEYYGKIFSFDNPPLIDKKLEIYGLPKQIWNCLPSHEQITVPFLYDRIFRRDYTGELTSLVTESSTIQLTPNHPVLTPKGWVSAKSLNIGDQIAQVSNESLFRVGTNPQDTKTTVEEFFSFYSILFNPERILSADFNFHGDRAINEQVNTINVERKLRSYIKSSFSEFSFEELFSETNKTFRGQNFSCSCSFEHAFPFGSFISQSLVSSLTLPFKFFFGSSFEVGGSSLFAISWLNSVLEKATGYNISRNAEFFSKLINASPTDKKFYQILFWELVIALIDREMSQLLHPMSERFRCTADFLGESSNRLPSFIKFNTILDKSISIFNGHVYNLQTSNHWYFTKNCITKNCSCQMQVVVPEVKMEINNGLSNICRKLKPRNIKYSRFTRREKV